MDEEKGMVLVKGQIRGVEDGAAHRYNSDMTMISIREAARQLDELARRVEAGESFTVTENGKPMMQLVPVKKKGGIDWEQGKAHKRERGITSFVEEIPVDFDTPLPEDILITPLPPHSAS